jgi:hypothetical protein
MVLESNAVRAVVYQGFVEQFTRPHGDSAWLRRKLDDPGPHANR